MDRPYHVLFLCTGNSARSIMAEALLNHLGKGRFRAFSAGSHPKGSLNPVVMALLAEEEIPVIARSKSWEEFSGPGAMPMDLVITVCDDAAGEACPIWPGRPATAHWGVPDPAACIDDPVKAQSVAELAFHTLRRRVELLIDLSPDKLDPAALQSRLRAIGARP